MRVSIRPKAFSALTVCLLISASILANFFAQEPQSSPTPTPEVSPSPSPTPTPLRAPSPTPLPGAQNFHQWGSVTVFNGLPSDSVRAIAQTPDGVMWFGTDNGLARFDGRRIQNYSLGEFGGPGILSLAAAYDQLWIGTRAGAYVYSDNRFQSVGGTEKMGITAILTGTEVFLGTDAGMVLRVSRDEGVLTAKPTFRDALRDADGTPVIITDLTHDRAGALIASTSGLGIFEIDDHGISPYSIRVRNPIVNALVLGSGPDIWIGTQASRGTSGIFFSGDGPIERVPAPTADVLALNFDPTSGIWAGTERFGLFHIVGGELEKNYTFENTSGGLRSNTVYALFTDREDVLWIGTNRGVSRFDRLGAEQQTVSDSPNSNFVRTLWWNGRALYAGSNRGFFEFDYEDESWKKIPGLEDRVIYDIGVNDQGLIVGTSAGTFDYRGRLIAGGDTRSIEYFGNKAYAAIVGRGVVDISSPRQEVVFSDETASALLATPDRLWIGTGTHGLFSFDGNSTKLELGPDSLKAGAIWNMSRDLDGSILIAGQHGVFRVANGEVEKVIEAEDVRDVYIDRSDHWVETPSPIWAATTTRGLLHARHDELFGWIVSSIGFEQGLPSEKAFSIAPLQGAVQYEGGTRLTAPHGLLVGTNRGVVAYRPGVVAPKIIATRVLSQRIHDLRELASTIALEYPQNSLLIEVAGQSSRTFPEEFQYAFVLTNAKGDEIGRRISSESQYSPENLSPGEYVIKAIAFNRDLLASEPLTIRFTVAKAPFPWTATALGVLLVIALLGLLWAFIANRRVLVRNRELAAAKLDLANEAERERRRIARDLHDQTLADLRSLMLMSDNANPGITGLRNEIEAISGEVRRICEDLSPSVLENVGLVAALEFLLKGTIENHRFFAVENLEERLVFPMHVQLQIYRIAQEILTNIRSHSDADFVEVELDDSNGEFVMSIRDNGNEFKPDRTISSGRGIANIKARSSMIGADVDWARSRKGENLFSLRMRK